MLHPSEKEMYTSAFHSFLDIIREFSPSLVGFSIGQGNEDKPNSYLNQAVAGADSE